MINIAMSALLATACMETATFGSPVFAAESARIVVAAAAQDETDEPETPIVEDRPAAAPAEVESIIDDGADADVLDEKQFSGPLAFEGESDEVVFDKVVDALENLSTLRGDFTQIAPSGAISTGQFYLRRPGLLRFEYDPPTPLLIVANGGLVYVRDDALETTDSYPVGQTPLKFLLRKRIDLDDAELVAVDRGIDTVAVTLSSRDEETDGEISIILSSDDLMLRRWIVRDAQNGSTIVTLDNVVSGERIANRLFRAPETGGAFLKN